MSATHEHAKAPALSPARLVPPARAQLELGRTDDPAEHEANRVTEERSHVHNRAPALLTHSTPIPISGPGDSFELDAERLADEIAPTRRAARSCDRSPLAYAPSSVRHVIDGPGRALAEDERLAGLPVDLSRVRVHMGIRAARSAREIGAAAYTVGNHIVFADEHRLTDAPGRRLLAHELAHVAQQQASGGEVGRRLFRQPAPSPTATSTVDYDSLYGEMWDARKAYLNLPNKQQLAAELESMMAELGGPGEKSAEQLSDLRKRFARFNAERATEYTKVMEWWPELTADYKKEDARLAQSTEATDRLARKLLSESYSAADKEVKRAGHLADIYDAMPFADELYQQRYLEKAWKIELRRSMEAGKHPSSHGEGHWPWPEFEFSAKLIEGAAAGGHISKELREELLRGLDDAIKYQVRQAVTEMVELGESLDAAEAWAAKALAAGKGGAEELVGKFLGRTGRALGRWHGRLHLAGKLTVAIDVVGSVVDIIASPPKERPKKVVIQTSRILAGFAGARIGASAGAAFGEEFGPEGGVVGGFVGGFAGGLEGAIFAEEIAEFVADEVWPPEDTSSEVLAD